MNHRGDYLRAVQIFKDFRLNILERLQSSLPVFFPVSTLWRPCLFAHSQILSYFYDYKGISLAQPNPFPPDLTFRPITHREQAPTHTVPPQFSNFRPEPSPPSLALLKSNKWHFDLLYRRITYLTQTKHPLLFHFDNLEEGTKVGPLNLNNHSNSLLGVCAMWTLV
jgi:hypothetical protein